MGNEHEKAEGYRICILKWHHQFTDRALDDPLVGPARMVDIEGRCTGCWGPVFALIDGNGHSIRLECRVCKRHVDAEAAGREWKRMILEMKRNMPRARVGRGANYDQRAKFVLKILPDMDRNKGEFEERVDDSMRRVQPKRGRERWLTRRDFAEKGSPGYLYLQACTLVSGIGALPHEMSALSFSDFDFENASALSLPTVDMQGRVRCSTQVPLNPPSREQMLERMGTATIAGFAAALACEVGMKAILMTRVDKVEKTHDLHALFESLPKDCQERLQADFTGIRETLRTYRHVFGKMRYFEPSSSQENAFLALVDMDRIWNLRRAARVIIDEGVIAGLQYDIDLRYQFTITQDGKSDSVSTAVSVDINGHESAIPWDKILLL